MRERPGRRMASLTTTDVRRQGGVAATGLAQMCPRAVTSA